MHIRVLDGQSKEYQVGLRVWKMIRYLLECRHDITRPKKVAITFDCAGESVSVEIKERQKLDEA